MSQLYLYSIVPVVSVSLLLFFTALLHGKNAKGLAAYCLAVAVWSGSLLLAFLPASAHLGQRLVASGGFVVAAYLHAAHDLLGGSTPDTRPPRLGWTIWTAYVVAAAIMLVHLVRPGLLYDPIALRGGPIFWPAMAVAMAAATLPLWQLIRACRRAQLEGRGQLFGLAAAGGLGYLGASANAILLSHGQVLPVGLFVVLASLFFLANVVRRQQAPSEQRLLQRSLAYAAIAAFISAGFLLGVLSLMGRAPLEYRMSTIFLLGMALLAFDPLRQQLQELVGRRLLRDRAGAAELAAALAEEEQRADQASRLAELGAFTSAVAHEVRGPLGVLSAQLHGLRERIDPQSLAEMQAQVRRAEVFVEDLLRYGRPRPLQLRQVDLGPLVELAFSTARQGRAELAEGVVLRPSGLDQGLSLEADRSQLLQVFVILFDNALSALDGRPEPTIHVHVTVEAGPERITIAVEDNGPGIDPQLLPRIFEPFVTGRQGVGLGLAIARRIVERHKGTISAGRAEPEGARFELQLPRDQRVLAAATGVSS